MRLSPASAPDTDAIDARIDFLVRGLQNPELVALGERMTQLLRAQRSSSGYTLARPADFGNALGALRGFLGAAERSFATRDPAVLDEYFRLIDRLENAGIRIYPSEHAQLTLLRAEALVAAAREPEAVAALAGMSARPHAIEGDTGTFRRLFAADMVARLSAGDAASLVPVALGRAQYLTRQQPWSAPATFRDMAPLLADAECHGPLAALVRQSARLLLAHRLVRPRSLLGRWRQRLALRRAVIQGVFGLLALALTRRRTPRLATATRHDDIAVPAVTPVPTPAVLTAPIATAMRSQPAAAPRPRRLVTRAMGGLGDILLMTPGLRALAAQIGGPVHFATKRAFFPILDGNPDVVLLDIDGEIALDAYDRWINLSHCPAGRYEAKTRPRVRRGRVEIFARAMKVRRSSLLRHGLRPRIELDATELDEVARLRSRLGAGGRTLIGLQPFSRDTYKNYPEILTVARHLARDHHVLVFHNFPVPLDNHPNITTLTNNSLRSNIVHVKACDFFVSVDSAFYHIAAAFDVPSVGIFGPTDGALFSLHHPRHLLAPTATRFACAPCWRNEDIPCYLTGRHQSACLANVDAGAILAAVEALERRFPKRPD